MPDAMIRVYGIVNQLFDLGECCLENKKPYHFGRVGFPEWKGSFDSKNRYYVDGPLYTSVVPCLGSSESVYGPPGQSVSGYPEPCVLIVSDTDSPEYRASGGAWCR